MSESPSGSGGSSASRRSEPADGGKDARAGQVLSGRYRIERLLAKGGMGRVYLATQLGLDRPVAIKILNPEFKDSDPNFVRRFCLEAAISARIVHPNVVTVHDYGETDAGELFMAMEYLKGKPLSHIIARDGPFAAERVLHVGLQISRALREAHAQGVIHRDLKPGNVMLLEAGDDPDFVKVLDFGLVKLFQPPGQAGFVQPEPKGVEADLTRSGTLLGSPRYMSPEQIRGDALDPRTDVYSLGVILFQMAAGRPPFSGATSVDVIYKHLNHPAPKIRSVTPDAEAPPELETIVRRCLEKSRDLRYASMADLIAALKEARRLVLGKIESSGSGASLRSRSFTASAPPPSADAPSGTRVPPQITANDRLPPPLVEAEPTRSEPARARPAELAAPDTSHAPRASSAARARPTDPPDLSGGLAREAAFREAGLSDDSVSGSIAARAKARKRSKVRFALALIALLGAAAALAVVAATRTGPEPQPTAGPIAPAPVVAPAQGAEPAQGAAQPAARAADPIRAGDPGAGPTDGAGKAGAAHGGDPAVAPDPARRDPGARPADGAASEPARSETRASDATKIRRDVKKPAPPRPAAPPRAAEPASTPAKTKQPAGYRDNPY